MPAHWLEAFFAHGGDGDCRASGTQDEASAGSFKEEDAPARLALEQQAVLYLHGPERAGQTSLLLQLAFSLARAGRNVVVVFFGHSDEEQQDYRAQHPIVPISPCERCHRPEPTGHDRAVWSRISIKYLASGAELQHFLCSFHMARSQAAALLIDGFDRFFPDETQMSAVYQTLAFTLETARFLAKSGGAGIALVAGLSNSFILRNRHALRRWCKFVKLTSDENDSTVFWMQEDYDDESEIDRECHFRLQYEHSLPRGGLPGVFQLMEIQDNEPKSGHW